MLRLVKEDPLPVNVDALLVRINADPLGADDLPIDLDPSLGDQCFSGTTRGNSSLGEGLLQADSAFDVHIFPHRSSSNSSSSSPVGR